MWRGAPFPYVMSRIVPGGWGAHTVGMIAAMSKTTPVGLHGREMWAYDAGLSLVLAEVVHCVEERPAERRPSWWPAVVGELRVHAAVSDLYFDLDLGLTADAREELARLLDEAAARLLDRRVVTAEEAAGWKVLFRGREPVDTAPIAELADALADLIRGTLPPSPPGTWWYYGEPGGRRTIPMQESGT